MTKLLIISDMKGVAGLERYEQCISGHPEYPEGVDLLCNEINAAAGAAFASGAQSVSVIDWHGGRGNLDPEQLDDRVEIVPEDLTGGCDLALLTGFHPMAGDRSGFISRTMTQDVALQVEGSEMGELSLLSWWMGDHNIPVGLITGDRAATAEADRLFPETPTHTVKSAESWSRAACVPVEQANTALRTRVEKVLRQRERWTVYRPPEPINFRLRLRDEVPTIPLIPWLHEDGDGWLSGSVQHARDLIDLLDVVSALMDVESRNEQVSWLSEEPKIREKLRQLQLERIEKAAQRERWVIDG